MIQFQHRMLAYLIAILAVVVWVRSRKGPLDGPARLLLVFTAAQVALGIATILSMAPTEGGAHTQWSLVALPAVHQFGAILLLAAALNHVHAARRG